ncbi:MAG: glycosyltransferase [Chloroflexi bacterium]|nr:glycosyltransferase [Chloroflexota bacterium]
MSAAPLVSVIMAVYNGQKYLEEAVESILGQTWSNFEFIAVDDGSTDSTPDILRSYGDRAYVHTQSNQGLSRALNTGLALARGKYIARMDADDMAEPQRLEEQVAYLDVHPEVGLLGTAYREIDAQGNILRTVTMPVSDAELRSTLARFNPFMHGSVMFRHTLIDGFGGYDDGALYQHNSEDYEFWIRLASHTQLANLPTPLMRRRVHTDSLVAANEDRRLRAEVVLRTRAIRTFGLPPWYWWYVLQPAVALRLPPTLRTLLRRVKL